MSAIAVFVMLVLPPVPVLGLIPCPSWDEGVYVSRKCFKWFPLTNGDWFMAQATCSYQEGDARLAEPRTLEEVEVLLETSLSRGAWIGAVDEFGDGHRFVSDNLTMDFFDRFVPTGTIGACAHTTGSIPTVFSSTPCISTIAQEGCFCEKAVSETYVIPSYIASGITMDIVANDESSQVQQLVIVFRDVDVEHPQYHVIDVAGPSDGKTYHFPYNNTMDELKFIQAKSVEIVTSHPMTLTLWWNDTESAVSSFSLHPFLEDLGRTNEEPSYVICSTSLVEQYFVVSVISRNQGATDVEVKFMTNPKTPKYITVDSVLLLNPKSVQASLTQFHSLNVNGTLKLDGTVVDASREVSVYVIVVVHDPYNTSLPSLVDIHQAYPFQAVNVQYFTFPSLSPLGSEYDHYKVVNLYRNTNVTINGIVHSMPTRGSTLDLMLPISQSLYVSGNKRFLLHRVFNGSFSAENDNDICTTPIITSDQWRSEYTVVKQWMSNVSMATIHIIIQQSKTQSVFLDDVQTTLTCTNITGSDDTVTCHHPVIKSTSTVFNIRASSTFGAYLVWVAGGKLGCQNLGLHWYGNWRSNVNGKTQTTTSAAVATTTETTPTTETPTTTITSPHSTLVTTTSSPGGDSTEPSSPLVPMDNMTCIGNGMIKRTNLTEYEIDQVVDYIQKTLHVDATKTSSFVRSKTSAEDHRPTSTGLGYGGIAFIVILLTGLVISDVITFYCKPSKSRSRT